MREFKHHCLMIKTHTVTKLKYLCKKSTDNIESCYTYSGSGTYWKKHLKAHGKTFTTEIIEVCSSKSDLTNKGIEWSKKLDVVASDEFANLVEERGDGGPTFLGRKHTTETLKKKSNSQKRAYALLSNEAKEAWRQKNKLSHMKYIYITPNGEFIDMELGAKENGISVWELRCRCRIYAGKTITGRRFTKYGWIGKTWKELGWDYKLIKPE